MAQNAPEPAPPAPAPAEPSQQSWDPAVLSMSVLSGHEAGHVSSEPQSNGTTGGSMADQAYAKLVNMDAFDLVKDKNQQKNPFEFATIGTNNSASLADMKKSSSVSSSRSFVVCEGKLS